MKDNIPEMKPDQDYIMRPQTPEEIKAWKDAEVPEYQIKLKLTPDQQVELSKNSFLEFEALKDDRKAHNLESAWADRDAQYDGDLAPIKNLDFAIDVRESKIKVDSVVRAVCEAFLPDSGDMIDVTPRPETARNDGYQIAEKQQQFLDFAIDEEIKPEQAIRKIATSAAKKYVGIGKLCWEFSQETRRREEHWEGKLTQVGTAPDGRPLVDNEGLRNFLSTYPDAPVRYRKQVETLMAGKNVDVVVKYKETISNNPVLKYIKIEDFYVRNDCQGNNGLKSEHLIAERQRYTYWELKKLQDDGDFENIEALWDSPATAGSDPGNADDYRTRTYEVIEFTTYVCLSDQDDEETKIKWWAGEESKAFLGAIVYPYYSIDVDYIGYWITDNDKGFYGDAQSMMFDMRDTHIAQDALISLILQSIYIRNIITPIVRDGSKTEAQFLENEFKTGRPIVVDDLTDDVNKAMSFVNWPATDTNGALVMLEKMKRIGSDVSRVSDMVSGGESEIDPNAPAQKTIALLQQSGIGIKDYIRTFLPSFNIFAGNLLQLYYQMSTEDRRYRIRSKSNQVTGKGIFDTLTRDQMVVRTSVQSRASAFAFDKVMEKREGIAAYQLVSQNSYSMQLPQVQYKALLTMLSTMGGRWKTMAETDLPSPEEFKQQQMMIAMEALKQLFGQIQAQAKTTGVKPDVAKVLEQAPGAISKAQAESYNPALIPKQNAQDAPQSTQGAQQ
jgi:hypothetical protein